MCLISDGGTGCARINRNIVECKYSWFSREYELCRVELIETLWNVNKYLRRQFFQRQRN